MQPWAALPMTASDTGMQPQRRLRVAITNPFVWPYVRRGSERLVHDLSHYLHDAGLDVRVIAMGPNDAQENRDGVRVRLLRERWRTPTRQLGSIHWFAWRLQAVLREEQPDVVFCLHYADAFAALKARERWGLTYRVIHQNVGIPVRRYFRSVPLDRWFFETVVKRADEFLVLSGFAQEQLESEFGRRAKVLAPPVRTEAFNDSRPQVAESPVVLFAGDAQEPRKGVRALCRAFARLHAQQPQLRLRIAGRADDALRRALLSLPDVAPARDAIEFSGLGRVEDLPAHFREAAVTVLPSVWEAFGLVLVESLAAGTPVVGARHGGIPEVIQGRLTGELFDPGEFAEQTDAVDALAAAMRTVLDRGKGPEVREACRERALDFGWERLGPRYLECIKAAA
jgi:phosphatidylinositol alpha-mannosyltransferase